MATTTPNYGWPVPTSSDLVKNGATAIEALGDAADATMATMVAKAIVDAKGDIIAATAADTVARLAVGANNTILTADSSTATGLKWAAAAGGGGKVLQVVMGTTTTTVSSSTTTPITTGLTASITPSATSSKILVFVSQNGGGTFTSVSNALQLYLYRNSTNITSYISRVVGLNALVYTATHSIAYLDSPSTTSATSYTTYFNNYAGGASVSFQVAAELSTIVLMEIGA